MMMDELTIIISPRLDNKMQLRTIIILLLIGSFIFQRLHVRF